MHDEPMALTQLLQAWTAGQDGAVDRLIPEVYDELRRLARAYLRREPSGRSLQTTALVNEAYIRLVGQKRVRWQNRGHFFGVAAQLMRRILVDRARARLAAKRASPPCEPFDERQAPAPGAVVRRSGAPRGSRGTRAVSPAAIRDRGTQILRRLASG